MRFWKRILKLLVVPDATALGTRLLAPIPLDAWVVILAAAGHSPAFLLSVEPTAQLACILGQRLNSGPVRSPLCSSLSACARVPH